MTDASSTAVDPIIADLGRLVAALEQSRAAILDGQDLSLDGLKDEIAAVCARAEAAPESRRDAYVAPLHQVISGLESLAAILSDRLSAEQELDAETSRRRAAVAYAAAGQQG